MAPKYTVGSVCSGIEAASVAWKPLEMVFEWFSEIAHFPARILKDKYPLVPNLGDMNGIVKKILKEEIAAPDILCGGTPCQAFSMAGWQKGLHDARGNLTLRFVDIIEANDKVRLQAGKSQTIVFWENVEGVLKDRTNAFGYLVSLLAGLCDAIFLKKWPCAGIVQGPKRTVVWRVLDAKFFGLPQQRRRLYLLAAAPETGLEKALFERCKNAPGFGVNYPPGPLSFYKDGHHFELFREYSDCLYSAYGTKWNGNAAAYNGSLFVVQDGRIRRFSPLECERLMGFPDNYTLLASARKTNRYQAIGNSWAVPVVRWLGRRLLDYRNNTEMEFEFLENISLLAKDRREFYDLGKDFVPLSDGYGLNCSASPEKPVFGSMINILSPDAPEDIYLSPVGCHGIIRRKKERGIVINKRLESVLERISSEMTDEEIEKRSLIQRRGKLGSPPQFIFEEKCPGSAGQQGSLLECFPK